MGRYRSPAPVKSPYITAGGYEKLRREADELWVLRREVTKALAAAAAEGDRSENAEYIYRKKQLREMDRRIGYLQRRLPELKVVHTGPSDTEKVFFGAWVTLEENDGTELSFRIVGADEFDPKQNWISVDSPMAKALLKRSVDQEFSVRTPSGDKSYLVIEVRYES
jgi:transcription elongation factor GreB